MAHTLTFVVQRSVLDTYSVELTDEQYAALIKEMAETGLEHESPEDHIEDTFYQTIPDLLGQDWDSTYEPDSYEHTQEESLLDTDGGIVYGNDDFEALFNKAQQLSVLLTNEND